MEREKERAESESAKKMDAAARHCALSLPSLPQSSRSLPHNESEETKDMVNLIKIEPNDTEICMRPLVCTVVHSPSGTAAACNRFFVGFFDGSVLFLSLTVLF